MSLTRSSSGEEKTSSMLEPRHIQKEQQRMTMTQVDQLQRENARIVAQLKEVTKMNTHWQRYDSQREEYVLKLTRTNQDLQNKVADLQRQLEELSNAKETEIKKQKPKLEGRAGYGEADDSRPQALKVPASLRKEEEIAALTDHIAKLKDKILELEKGRETRMKEDDDQLTVLREQVNICIEDFKQERRDRERIHSDNEKLRERLEKTEQDIMRKDEQLYLYQEQIERLQERRQLHVSNPPQRKTCDGPCYPGDRPNSHRAPMPTRRAFRHPMNLGDDLTDDVEIDGIPADQKAFDHVDEADGAATGLCIKGQQDEEPLQCPKCLAPFSIKNHTDLLDHINTCLV